MNAYFRLYYLIISGSIIQLPLYPTAIILTAKEMSHRTPSMVVLVAVHFNTVVMSKLVKSKYELICLFIILPKTLYCGLHLAQYSTSTNLVPN